MSGFSCVFFLSQAGDTLIGSIGIEVLRLLLDGGGDEKDVQGFREGSLILDNAEMDIRVCR